jgi:hypothetical protein
LARRDEILREAIELGGRYECAAGAWCEHAKSEGEHE